MQHRPALSIIIILSCISILSAQNSENLAINTQQAALVRSLIMPGWGQHLLGDGKTAEKFITAEVGLWLSYFTTREAARWFEQDYRAFAILHAGASQQREPDIYYYRLGQYDSIYEYNEIQLRQRSIGDIYELGVGKDWQWSSTADRARYNDLRRASLLAAKTASFIVGGMIVNRAVSAIHVLFLTRTEVEASAFWIPLQGGGSLRIDVQW